MSISGFEPYENDAAADWLSNLMHITKVRKAWRIGIAVNVEHEPEVARAAVWVFIQFGLLQCWPEDDYNADLELAIIVADRLRSSERLCEVEGMQAKLEREHRILLERRAPRNAETRIGGTPLS